MLYHLFNFLDKEFDLVGASLFNYITFRAAMAMIVSLIITITFGKRIIRKLQSLQIGETVRELGLDGQSEKAGTPTMGGLIIISAIVIPVLLFANLTNIYIIVLLITTLGLGGIGFLDDYIKVFRKNKEGLAGRFKIVGQVGIGLIVGLTLFYHPDVEVRQYYGTEGQPVTTVTDSYKDIKSTKTTMPFVKDNDIVYSDLIPFLPKGFEVIIFVLAVTFIITAVSNGANMTDGIDGLAAGTSAISSTTLLIFTYLSGNVIFSNYLNIMYIPHSGELVIFLAAFTGACIGFLWYNAFPAQVFMGDTGSLAIGGIIAVLAIAIRKEFLLPVVCFIFMIESLSVMMQVGYFKYTKRKTGTGKRIFLMAPIHHHYQKKGIKEAKIVMRFLIVAILFALISLTILKVR
ncbi:phospho-N-acetylmuramoyl-pentapeptide-transferase [Persicobacter psychrovividus]|uniref:Phospho-N-acetylmuramoyl-pentapeptide-transferase n=1 Tax=Persicobacter psychrovividus TaxID=387638 RepID=A0ABM7VFG8_9BACT|nr:phospho-N-acetylmuramoyl-pentapeptide-transferase [Persicobacter psychrovividus]